MMVPRVEFEESRDVLCNDLKSHLLKFKVNAWTYWLWHPLFHLKLHLLRRFQKNMKLVIKLHQQQWWHKIWNYNNRKFQVTASIGIDCHRDKEAKQSIDQFIDEKHLPCFNNLSQIAKKIRVRPSNRSNPSQFWCHHLTELTEKVVKPSVPREHLLKKYQLKKKSSVKLRNLIFPTSNSSKSTASNKKTSSMMKLVKLNKQCISSG